MLLAIIYQKDTLACIRSAARTSELIETHIYVGGGKYSRASLVNHLFGSRATYHMQVHVSETRRKGGPKLRWINIWGENDDKMKCAIIRNGLDSAMSNIFVYIIAISHMLCVVKTVIV